MTAEAIARVRAEVAKWEAFVEDDTRDDHDLDVADLRALLDAHTFLDQYNFTLQHSLREAQKSRDWHAAQTRVVEAAHAEALDALKGLLGGMVRTHGDETDGETLYAVRIDRVGAAVAVLAKAGRR